MNVVECLYNFATLAAPVAAAPIFFLRRRGRDRFSERLGCWNLKEDRIVWFHGASAGEVRGLIPVIQGISRCVPHARTLVSATSPTGLDQVGSSSDHVRLLPFDNSFWFSRALRGTILEAFIFSETEIWPGLISWLHRRDVPIVLINARISDNSFGRYKRFRFLIAPTLQRLDMIVAATETDRERLLYLGARADRIIVGGNSKYDRPRLIADSERVHYKNSFFPYSSDLPVLTLGSIRPAEEQVWFPALSGSSIFREGGINVVVAPRHHERMEYFAQQLAAAEIPFRRSSEKKAEGRYPGEGDRVVLLDTFGELETAYSFSEAAFIGATLVDIGGHNPVEAAAYGAAVIVGPYVHNISDVVHALRRQGAVFEICNQAGAANILSKLQQDLKTVREAGCKGMKVAAGCIGASERILQAVEMVLLKRAASRKVDQVCIG